MTDHLTETDRALCEALEAFTERHEEIIGNIYDAATTIRTLSRDKAELQALADKLAEALEAMKLFHESGGHEGDADTALASAVLALAAHTLHKIDG